MTPQPDFIIYTKKNRNDINNSTECACISCLMVFIPQHIINWIITEELNAIFPLDTALCPYCSAQMVIANNIIEYTADMLYIWNIEYNNYSNYANYNYGNYNHNYGNYGYNYYNYDSNEDDYDENV